MSYSFLTSHGYESFAYNWTQNLTLDDSKPLTLLEHVGGSPLLAAVSRTKYSPQEYDMLVKWLKKGYGYFEDVAVPQMDQEDQEKFRLFSGLGIPLLERIDAATRNDLIPALADGQAGFVLDAGITSKQWHKDMPALGKPLPMAEVALVLGVSDAERLKKAFREYFAVAQAAVDKVHDLDANAVPEGFKIPGPMVREASDGQVYWYPIPAQAKLDPQIQPAAGLSKNVAVLSTSTKQVERMLARSPLKARSDLISSRKTLGTAVHFDFAGLVSAVEPWVEGGLIHWASGRSAGDDEAESLSRKAQPQVKQILDQIRTGAEILKCYRGTTSVSYLQDSATVSHSESIFEDLK